MANKAGSEAASRPKSDDDADADVAAVIGSAEELSPDEDRRLLRTIDRCLLPFMALSYLFQYLDKLALTFTAIMGLPTDLHLSGTAYSWASGIYYFGYLVASYPAGAIMVRWRVGKTIATALALWGAVLMFTAVTTNAGGLLAVRFFLGVTEAPIAPGLTVMVAMWYKRGEQPLRHAAWFLGNTLAGICGGLVAYGIGHIGGIASWKALFLIFGAATVVWSVAVFLWLPDVPGSAWFLDEADRPKAVARVRENMTGIKSDEFKWRQCREALLDVKTWLLVVIVLCANIPNGGVSSFGSIVIKGFGFDALPTLLLQSASYLVQLVLVLFCTGATAYLANTRTYFMVLNSGLAVVGAAMVRQVQAEHRWTRYSGYCLMISFSANFPLISAMVSGNFGGFTKKMTATAATFVAYCAGNIVGPQIFIAQEAPSYPSGLLGTIICFSIGGASCIALRLYLVRENRRRDQADRISGPRVVEGGLMVNLMDKTDKEIPQFRYVY